MLRKQGKSPEITAKFIKDRYEAGLKGIRGELRDYWLNHSFLLGNQWLWFNPVTSRLDELPRDPDRVQATINRMRANARTLMAKLNDRELTFEVPPTASDDATIRGARTSQSALEAVRIQHDWEKKREINGWVALKGGTSAIAVDWDPTLRNHIATTPEGVDVYEGDTVETVLSIAEFVVEPGSQDAEKARYWIKAQALPPGTVQATYGLDKPPKADVTAGMSPFQLKILTASNRGGEIVDLTLVLTYYERPNPERPKGAVAVLVGDQIVDGPKDWPFPWDDHLNFAITHESVNESRWAGDTILNQARPIQTALNASWSSIIEHMKLAGNARMFVPQSAIDLMEQMTDLPGELVPYLDGTAVPQWQSPPQMPAWWIEQPQVLAAELDDIMGVHSVSRGEAPVNVESGFGLSVLAEQDSGPVGRLAKETAHAWSKVGTMVLKLYVQNVKTKRKAVVQAPGQPAETTEWVGSDLQGQTQAIVPLDAVIPRSRASMQALGEKAVQMGLITSFSQFARIIELPDQNRIIEAVNPDVAKARRENAMMAQGEAILPSEIDQHAVHIDEHHTDMKSVRFELLTEPGKQVYFDHVQAHENLAAQAAARMAAKAAISPALAMAPDRAGTPPPPPEAMVPAGATPPTAPDAPAPPTQ